MTARVLVVDDILSNVKLLEAKLAAEYFEVITAFAMKGDEDVIRQGGCEAYISKPISVTSFLDTVRRFIG